MVAFITSCVIVVLVGMCFSKYMIYLENIIKLVATGKDLYLRNIILFSNYELARYIKKGFKKGAKSIKIYYFNNEYITIKSSDNRKEIESKIDMIQDRLINESYNNSTNALIKSRVDEKILDVWVNYSHSRRYRKIFRLQLERMSPLNEISTTLYNSIIRRFYNFQK